LPHIDKKNTKNMKVGVVSHW